MNEAAQTSDMIIIPMTDVDRPGFLMSTVDGSDLVATKVRDSGWWSFEQPLPAVMLRTVQRWPGMVLDIGANTGFYSMLLTAADPGVTVTAFEPDPAVLIKLCHNLALNALSGRVVVQPIGLSNQSGESTLFIPLQTHGLVETSSSLDREFKGEHSEEIQVAIATVDELMETLAALSLVKIDVEGHEKEAFEGAEKTFARLRPIIAVELLDRANYGYFNSWKAANNYTSFALRFSSAVREDQMAFDPAAWNHALVPAEKVDDFLEVLASLQVHLLNPAT